MTVNVRDGLTNLRLFLTSSAFGNRTHLTLVRRGKLHVRSTPPIFCVKMSSGKEYITPEVGPNLPRPFNNLRTRRIEEYRVKPPPNNNGQISLRRFRRDLTNLTRAPFIPHPTRNLTGTNNERLQGRTHTFSHDRANTINRSTNVSRRRLINETQLASRRSPTGTRLNIGNRGRFQRLGLASTIVRDHTRLNRF